MGQQARRLPGLAPTVSARWAEPLLQPARPFTCDQDSSRMTLLNHGGLRAVTSAIGARSGDWLWAFARSGSLPAANEANAREGPTQRRWWDT